MLMNCLLSYYVNVRGINAKTNVQVVERCKNLCMVMQRLRTPIVGFSIINIIVLPSHSFSVCIINP